jgi:hypothetical protein
LSFEQKPKAKRLVVSFGLLREGGERVRKREGEGGRERKREKNKKREF